MILKCLKRGMMPLAMLFLGFCIASAGEADTDGDGFPDALELALQTNPGDPKSTPFNGKPAGTPVAIDKAGARVFLDFNSTQPDSVTLFGNLSAPNLASVAGQKIAVDLGGFVSLFTLDDDGHAQTPLAVIDVRKVTGGVHFLMTIETADLDTIFASSGLLNVDVSQQSIALDLTIISGQTKYFTALTGFYNAKANSSGSAFLGVVANDAKLKRQLVKFDSVKITPNPAKAGEAVMFKADVSIKDLTGDIIGRMHFGDDAPPIRVDGKTLQTMLKTGITHTYATDGVYKVRLGFNGDNEVLATKLFVVVGKNFIVNPLDGSVSRIAKDGNGAITLTHFTDNVPNAMSASTTFRDLGGNPIGIPRDFRTAATTAPSDPQVGLSVSRVFVNPGIYVAEIQLVDGNGKKRGKIRKTITINSTDLGGSAAARDAEAEPRADGTTDGTLNLASLAGKFLFTSSKQDKVTFTGSFTLPVGYNPKQTGGNDISIGMGNVLDTVHLDEKGKATLPTTENRITKFTMRVPKLATGVATGTETARVSMTMNVADLDIQGFDSEGITASVRSDESNQTSVARYVQVDMLVGGQTFSVLSSVEFKLDSNSLFGTISGRN